MRAAVLAAFALILWFLLSNEFHYWSIIMGIVFCAAVSVYSYNIFYEKEIYYRSDFIIRFEFFLLYLILFVYQSYAASFELIYRIITGKYQPGTVRIKTRLRSKIGRVFLANTISMVPGTLSLWLDDSNIYIHWFDVKTTHSVKAGYIIKKDFEKILGKIFG